MIVKRAAMLLKLFKLNLSSHVRVFFVLGNVRFKPRHTSRRRVSQAQLEGKEILKVNGIVFLPSPPPFLWIIFSLFLSPILPQNRFVSFLPPPFPLNSRPPLLKEFPQCRLECIVLLQVARSSL